MEKQPLYNAEESDDDYNTINGNESDVHSNNDSSNYEGSMLFEEAIASTGTGSFHYLLICVCGWALASDSVEIQVLFLIDFILLCIQQLKMALINISKLKPNSKGHFSP